jgi:hypothetical protein
MRMLSHDYAIAGAGSAGRPVASSGNDKVTPGIPAA